MLNTTANVNSHANSDHVIVMIRGFVVNRDVSTIRNMNLQAIMTILCFYLWFLDAVLFQPNSAENILNRLNQNANQYQGSDRVESMRCIP